MSEFHDIFRLGRRPGEGVFCDLDGLSVGDVVLLERAADSNGARAWRRRPVDDLNRELSRCYGLPIEVEPKAGGLESVAWALDRGDLVHAQMVALHLCFPDPPDLAKSQGDAQTLIDLAARLEASGLLKGDWDSRRHPRWPPGSQDRMGGRFAPEDVQGAGVPASGSHGAQAAHRATGPADKDRTPVWIDISPKTLADYVASLKTSWAFHRVPTPDAAPKTIDLSSMNEMFQSMTRESLTHFPIKETGVTLFGDSKGNLFLGNYGGTGRDEGSFFPEFDPARFYVAASFTVDHAWRFSYSSL